ncbi:hypothetical protein EI94DRAFT_1697900 [Lactarius quietus]|nr:hypothetical protein EI94DRAFT_1697900 [Lactarius quietus]
MTPKVKDMLTDEEEALIEIAVWLDYAICYWERALAHGVHIDDAWYEQCIRKEMDNINEIFDVHGHNHPGTPYPRIHTIIELIGEEWQHKVNGQTDEEKELDFSNFSRSHCLEWLNALKAQHPNLKSKIMMTNLPTLMQYQECIEWWKPRTLDFNNEEVDQLSDEGGEKTPQMSHMHKHMIVTLPSEVDAPPARHPQMTNAKDFCGPCQDAGATRCLPQEKKNVTACLACAIKKRPCSPPPKWACNIGTESIKAEILVSHFAKHILAMLEDIVPSLERVEWTVLADGMEFCDRLLNIEACLQLMAAMSGVDLLSLNCTPPIPLFNTSSLVASFASTPLSINPAHISTLSIQEPLGAGPSGSSTTASNTQSSLGEGMATASSSQVLSVAGLQALSRTG